MLVLATVDSAAEETPVDHEVGGYVDVSALVAHWTVNTAVGVVPDTAVMFTTTSNTLGFTSSMGVRGPVEPVRVTTVPAGRMVW